MAGQRSGSWYYTTARKLAREGGQPGSHSSLPINQPAGLSLYLWFGLVQCVRWGDTYSYRADGNEADMFWKTFRTLRRLLPYGHEFLCL